MSYTFYVKAEGVAACLESIDKKDKKVRAGVRKALRRGGTRVKRSAKQKVGRKTGNLKKSIISKNYKLSVHVMASTGRTRKGDRLKGYHAHLVEYGHKGSTVEPISPHRALKIALLTKTGRLSKRSRFAARAEAGPAAPHPFMRPALKEQEPSIIAEIRRNTQEAVK